MRLSILEREIKTGSHHAKVVIRAVDHVPAKIADPADMRRKTDFHAGAKLPDRSRLRTCPARNDNVVFLAFLNVGSQHELRLLASAKYATAARPHVRRKARAGNRVAEGQRTQD